VRQGHIKISTSFPAEFQERRSFVLNSQSNFKADIDIEATLGAQTLG